MTQTQAPATTKRSNPYLATIIWVASLGILGGGAIWGMGIYTGRPDTFYEGSQTALTMMDIGGNVFGVGVLFACAALLYGALARNRG